jgi:hypothetical protein
MHCSCVQVTGLVRSHGDVTLAIGDGANDVGMIQVGGVEALAHITFCCVQAPLHWRWRIMLTRTCLEHRVHT